MNIYGENYKDYLDKNLQVIPDKAGTKLPAVKGWSKYCLEPLERIQAQEWANTFTKSNISLCLGEASGVIALDFDSNDKEVFELLKDLLPLSPVEKKSDNNKIKFTRFFRFSGERTQTLSLNGKIVLEILSNKKKTTLPPSIHPDTGTPYVWSGEMSLVDINVKELPSLDPYFLVKCKERIAHLQKSKEINTTSGRNNYLKKEAARMIGNRIPFDTAITRLIEFDESINEPPLFSDMDEFASPDKLYNAINFYTNIFRAINEEHVFRNQQLELPYIIKPKPLDIEELVGKKVTKRMLEIDLPENSYLTDVYKTILSNSIKKQPELAVSAAISCMATLMNQGFRFQGVTPNVYLLNVSKSGTGKQAPQETVQKILQVVNRQLLGNSDYASDSSILKSLALSPVRLDIIDEAGGFFRSATRGKEVYMSKIGDVLAEIYTQADNEYLGKVLASQDKALGICKRPHISLLASTTPTGFKEGLNQTALEKGLLGRFMIFFGRDDVRGSRLKRSSSLPANLLESLKRYNNNGIFGKEPKEMKCTKEADELLDYHFNKYQDMLMDCQEVMRPVINRLYTHLIKFSMIFAGSKYNDYYTITKQDIEIGVRLVEYYYDLMKDIVQTNLSRNQNEENILYVLNKIQELGHKGINKKELISKTRNIPINLRKMIIQDLVESGIVLCTMLRDEKDNGVEHYYYKG